MIISVGDSYRETKRFVQEDIIRFSQLIGDTNPIHTDPEFARNTKFGKPVVHGMLVASLASSVFGTKFPGKGAIYLGQSLKFINPVFVEDVITLEAQVIKVREDKPVITLSTNFWNQHATKVIEGEAVILMPA